MTANREDVLRQVADILRTTTERIPPDEPITMRTRLGDLDIESIELVGIAGRVQGHFGDRVNFAHFLVGLNADRLADLSVGQLVDFVCDALSSVDAESAPAAGN